MTIAASATTALRLLRVGDAWHYAVEGTVGEGDHARPVSGSIVVSVEPDPVAMMLVFRQSLAIDDVVLPTPAGIFLFTQETETGDLSIVGDNMGEAGRRRLAFQPRLFYPGRWSARTRYDNRLEFEGGSFVRNTLAVECQDRVVTPLGVHSAWVAHFSSEGSAMGCLAGTDWWAPELGAPVRFESHSTQPGGRAMRICATIHTARLAGHDTA